MANTLSQLQRAVQGQFSLAPGNLFDGILTPLTETSELLGVPFHMLDSNEWDYVTPPSPVLSSESPVLERRKIETGISCFTPQPVEIGSSSNLVGEYFTNQTDKVVPPMLEPSEAFRIIEGLLENLRFKIGKTQWTRDLHEFTSDFSCPQELVPGIKAIFEGKRGFKYVGTSQHRPCWAIVSFIVKVLISMIVWIFPLRCLWQRRGRKVSWNDRYNDWIHGDL